jgi:hypothetical protein
MSVPLNNLDARRNCKATLAMAIGVQQSSDIKLVQCVAWSLGALTKRARNKCRPAAHLAFSSLSWVFCSRSRRSTRAL